MELTCLTDETLTAEKTAVAKADVALDCVTVDVRKNNCSCQLYNGECCILQFTDQEAEQIR